MAEEDSGGTRFRGSLGTFTTTVSVGDVLAQYAERVFGETDDDTIAVLEQRRNLAVVLTLSSLSSRSQGNFGQ